MDLRPTFFSPPLQTENSFGEGIVYGRKLSGAARSASVLEGVLRVRRGIHERYERVGATVCSQRTSLSW
jgi:hypothetical protein